MTLSSALHNAELDWTYPSAGERAFVLRANGNQIGWLRFEKEPGSFSAAELEGSRWTFERTGPTHSGIVIRAAGSNQPAAEFSSSLSGGAVAFASGARYSWIRQHPWSSRWCFRSKEPKSMVCVTQEARPLQSGSKVTVCCDAAGNPETPLLVLLAWYLRVLDFERLTESVFVCG